MNFEKALILISKKIKNRSNWAFICSLHAAFIVYYSIKSVFFFKKKFHGTSNTIVFFAVTPTFSQAKIAKELILNGITVKLLYIKSANFDLYKYFSNVTKVKNQFHAICELPPYKWLHCFSTSIDPATSYLLKHNTNTIYHPTDVLINADNQDNSSKISQYNAFLNADRIVYRELTTLTIHDLRLIIKNKKSIFFPDYLSNPIESKKLPGIHIVSTGNLQIGCVDNGSELYTFIKFVISNGIYFHIYPFWGWSSRPHQEFLDAHDSLYQLALQNPKLVIHKTINPELLQGEISQYQFGIIIRPEFDKKYHQIKSNYSLNWLSKTTSARMSNYMEANLITITNWNNKKDLCYRIPKRYSHCLHYHDILNSINPSELLLEEINKLKNKNDGYRISKNITRLIEFYK